MVKYNVGCGWRNFGHDWFHVDGGNYQHVANHDVSLSQSPDGIADLIYSSHMIAYFSTDELQHLLSNWYRVLKPGGILEIATPDFSKLALLHSKGVSLDRLIGPLYGKMNMNDEAIYHKIVYDFYSLKNILLQAGFVDVYKYDHRETCHPNTGNRNDRYDDHSAAYIDGELISLNVQCKKP